MRRRQAWAVLILLAFFLFLIGLQIARPGLGSLVYDAGAVLIIVGLLGVAAALTARAIRGRSRK